MQHKHYYIVFIIIVALMTGCTGTSSRDIVAIGIFSLFAIAFALVSTVATHNSDAEAKTATGMAAQAMAHGLDEAKAGFGDAVFSYTFKCTKVSNGAQVITYYVDFSKGDVNYYSNEN